MNARISVPTADSLGLALASLWDPELERNILGAAMLAEPMPDWLEPRMFFPGQHQAIYRAVQDVGGNVAKVNAWMRESSPEYKPFLVTSAELWTMCDEADFMFTMGWSIDYERLRELWRQRELVSTMQRVTVELRHGSIDHREARSRLSDHFVGCK